MSLWVVGGNVELGSSGDSLSALKSGKQAEAFKLEADRI